MDRDEVIDLGRKVAAICPAQKFNADTPDAWEALLGWVDYQDALAALYVLGQTERFIAPADIIREVKKVRRDRLRHHVVPAPADPDDTVKYRHQVRQATQQAAAPAPPGRLALTAGPDEVTARRAAQLRAAGGGRPVSPRSGQHAHNGPVADMLSEVRLQCEEAARQRRGDDPPRKAWVPPASPSPRREDLSPLSGEILRSALPQNPT